MTMQLWSVIIASRAAAACRQPELLCGSSIELRMCKYSFIAGMDKVRAFAGMNIQDGL